MGWFRGAVLATCLVSMVGMGEARADLDVATYRAARDTEMVQTYVAGLGMGYRYANVKAGRHNWFYCPPENWSYTKEVMLELIDDEIAWWMRNQSYMNVNHMTVEMLLLDGLQKRFPCKPAKARPAKVSPGKVSPGKGN